MSAQLRFIQNKIIQAVAASLCGVLVASLGFVVMEPTVSRAITGTPFTIRTQITPEISFLTQAANVVATGTIAGVTGGSATGTTFAVIQTNSTTGYTMDISFLNNPAMLGETTGSISIRDYGTSTAAEPTLLFNASTSAQFAYTVNASTTADLDQSFKNNASTCNAGAGFTVNSCWKGPSTSNYRIINRSTAANTGATTTLTFLVSVPSSPSPALQSDFYTATATLTAVTQ